MKNKDKKDINGTDGIMNIITHPAFSGDSVSIRAVATKDGYEDGVGDFQEVYATDIKNKINK